MSINIAPPQVFMPGGTTGQPVIAQAQPGTHLKDSTIVILNQGTQASGFFALGGTYLPGDSITVTVNGIPETVLVPVNYLSTLAGAVTAVTAVINANQNSMLVNATIQPGSNPVIPNVVFLQALTPGTDGNAITIVATTTSAAGTITASGANLVGGTAVTGISELFPAPINVAGGIAGLTIQDSNENYGGWINTAPPLLSVFGSAQGPPLVPLDASLTKYAKLQSPALLEINLSADTGWISGGAGQAQFGTSVGLGIDPTTGYYVLVTGSSNLVASIVEPILGFSQGFGAPGTLAQRVRAAFFPSVLV